MGQDPGGLGEEKGAGELQAAQVSTHKLFRRTYLFCDFNTIDPPSRTSFFVLRFRRLPKVGPVTRHNYVQSLRYVFRVLILEQRARIFRALNAAFFVCVQMSSSRKLFSLDIHLKLRHSDRNNLIFMNRTQDKT